LPSILLRYAFEMVQTRKLGGSFRSFAWEGGGDRLIVVGDGGQILTIEGEKAVKLVSGTHQNLRGISINPTDGTALIVGNAGTVLLLRREDLSVRRLDAPTSENLRAASWNPRGTSALISGNQGALLRYSSQRLELLGAARANLRHIAWSSASGKALVTSNCFAEEFIPSPNLFAYDPANQTLSSLNEGRSDLIGVDWKADGTIALVVGYDVIWHNGEIAVFDGVNLSHVEFNNKRVYPVAVSWKPSVELATIVTSTPQPGMGKGVVYLWDRKSLRTIYSNDLVFFSAVAWNKDGTELAALGSSMSRTFNC
jgi:WD40 repeat protein